MNLIGAGWRFAEPASIQIMEGVRSNDRPDVIGPPCEFRPAFPGIRCRNFNGTDDNAVAPNRGEPMYGKGTLEESGGLPEFFGERVGDVPSNTGYRAGADVEEPTYPATLEI